jgi:putative membrane protein
LRFLLADPVDLADRFRPWTPAFLVFVLGAILASEFRGRARLRRIVRSAWVQGLAALLGVAVLRGPILIDPDTALFPLFSGLFGIPTLLIGIRARPGRIPYQRHEPLRALSTDDGRNALRGTFAGAFVSWLPGLSGGAAATLACVGTKRAMGPSQFMVVLGAVSTSTALLSVAVLFVIHRARSGAAAAVRGLLGDLAPWSSLGSAPISLVVLMASAVLATAIAAPLATRIGRSLARRWSRVDPRWICGLALLAVLVLLTVATGLVGVALAGLATVVGLVPVVLRVRRVHLMAALLVPVLLTYVVGSA